MTIQQLREWITVIETDLLQEKMQQYQQMFQSVLDDMEEKDRARYEEKVEIEIKWARQKLKKNDRIVWYLRWYRALLAYHQLGPTSSIAQKALRQVNQVTGGNSSTHAVNQIILSGFKIDLEHFLSLGIRDIDNYVWGSDEPNELLSKFTQMEINNRKDLGDDDRLLAIEEHHDKIIEFGDGSAWFNLNVEYCDREAEAMGHCGNSASNEEGDQVLSYRTLHKTGNWIPHLTFILDSNGFLGEMKGRANEKPRDKYHKYIIELLKQPFVKAIKGGGYDPESNFSMDDLDEIQKNNLIKKKPALGKFREHFKSEGISSVLINRIYSILSGYDDIADVAFNKEDNSFTVDKDKNIEDFIRYNGSDYDRRIFAYLSGAEVINADQTPTYEDLNYIYESLPDTYQKIFNKYVEKNYRDNIDGDMSSQDYIQLLDDEGDILAEDLYKAWRAGSDSGVYKQINLAFDDAIDDLDGYLHYADSKSNLIIQFDRPVEYRLPLSTLIELLDNTEDDRWDDMISGSWIPNDALDLKYHMKKREFDDFDEDEARDDFMSQMKYHFKNGQMNVHFNIKDDKPKL